MEEEGGAPGAAREQVAADPQRRAGRGLEHRALGRRADHRRLRERRGEARVQRSGGGDQPGDLGSAEPEDGSEALRTDLVPWTRPFRFADVEQSPARLVLVEVGGGDEHPGILTVQPRQDPGEEAVGGRTAAVVDDQGRGGPADEELHRDQSAHLGDPVAAVEKPLGDGAVEGPLGDGAVEEPLDDGLPGGRDHAPSVPPRGGHRPDVLIAVPFG